MALPAADASEKTLSIDGKSITLNIVRPHNVQYPYSCSSTVAAGFWAMSQHIVRWTSLSTLLPAKTAFAQDDLVVIALEPEQLQRTAVLMRRKDACLSFATQVFTALTVEISGKLTV